MNAGALGEHAEGFAVGEFVEFLDEFEDVAAGAADEAVEDLFLRDDGHGGFVVVVEGAEAFEFLAGAFERDAFADDLDDVDGGTDFFEDFRVRVHDGEV